MHTRIVVLSSLCCAVQHDMIWVLLCHPICCCHAAKALLWSHEVHISCIKCNPCAITRLEAGMQDLCMACSHLNTRVILVHVGVIGYVVVYNHLCQHVAPCINSPLVPLMALLSHQRRLNLLDMQCGYDMHPCHAGSLHCTADQPNLDGSCPETSKDTSCSNL